MFKINRKFVLSVILSLVAIIGGMILNFGEFLRGSPATPKNLIVTLVYIAMWILVLVIGAKSKNRGIIIYCSIFWFITLFLSMVTAYVNAYQASADWALPLVVLLLGQWYGVNFFVESYYAASIVMALVSLMMFLITVIVLRGQPGFKSLVLQTVYVHYICPAGGFFHITQNIL